MAKIDFLSLLDFERAELDEILGKAARLKADLRAGRPSEPLRGKVLGVIFHKPSLRTRISFEVGMHQLGGSSLHITDQEIGFGKREAVKDIGAVMSRFLSAIMIRTFAQANVVELAHWATVPVINGLTDAVHPCQVMADLMTVREKGFDLDAIRVAWIGDGNNVANTWIHAARAYGFQMTLACPEGHDPDAESVARVRREGRGSIELVRDPRAAARGAQVVITDTWTSMGQEAEAQERRRKFAGYQVNRELLKLADPRAIVLHCLPAHRGEEITDEVIDGPQSVVYDEAENRLHAQKGILVHCLG